MNNNNRPFNMSLIIWQNKGHKLVSQTLSNRVNSAYLSEMARGLREIPDKLARGIESDFMLPKGWLDRDNSKILRLSTTQYNLLKAVENLNEEQQAALLTLLNPPQKNSINESTN